MLLRTSLLALLLLVLGGTFASAQTVNPKNIKWEYTPAEHATLSHYELGFYAGTAVTPVQLTRIEKAAITNTNQPGETPPDVVWDTALPRPILGTLTARLRACALDVTNQTVCSDWSNATEQFTFGPLVPVNFGIRP